MLLDIRLLDGSTDVTPAGPTGCLPVTLRPLPLIPPLWHQAWPLLRQCEESAEIWEWIFASIQSARIPKKHVFVFDSETVAIDEPGEDVFHGQFV